MVRYYGYYSNVARDKRKIGDQDELIPSILEPDESSKERRKNWSRLIQKIYEVDPLTCPKCSGEMKVISDYSTSQIPVSDNLSRGPSALSSGPKGL
jgi:ferritin-like protein